MKRSESSNNGGFSLIELMIAMTVMLVLLGITGGLLASSFKTRSRESRRADALTTARAAINVMSREIANSGYGMSKKVGDEYSPINGIILNDSNKNQIHFQSNIFNDNSCTKDRGEDVTYFFDNATQSIVRHERFASNANPCDPTAVLETETSVIVNRISNVTFRYFNYASNSSTVLEAAGTENPTVNTGRVRITVEVKLEEIPGQPTNQKITFSSDVTLRNSKYMLNQY